MNDQARRARVRVLLVLLALAGALPQGALAQSDAERARLEEELRAELGASEKNEPGSKTEEFLRNPRISLGANYIDLSAIWVQSVNYFSDAPTTRFDAHEPNSATDGWNIQLQELEAALQGYVDPYVRADVFLSFGTGGVEIEEGYLTTLQLPWNLQARAGQFYAPFGRFNTEHFFETTPFADMPLVNRRFFGGEQLRGLGGELSWLVPLPWFVELTAAVQTPGNEVSLGIPTDETSSVKELLTVARLRQYWDLSDSLYLEASGSFAGAGNDTGGATLRDENRTYFYGASVYLKWRDLSALRWVALRSEYIVRDAELPGARLTEGGVYAWIETRLSRRWELAARFDYFGLPSNLDGGVLLVANPELLPFHEPSDQWRAGAAATYYPSEFFHLRTQYNYDKVRGGIAGIVPERDGVHEVVLQFQFNIGPHGAHPF